jgi:hypothetical protein
LRALGLKSRTHCAEEPIAAIFSCGTNILELPTRQTVASTPAVIHSAMFIINSLIEDFRTRDEAATRPVTRPNPDSGETWVTPRRVTGVRADSSQG